jgi:hypothetical protein
MSVCHPVVEGSVDSVLSIRAGEISRFPQLVATPAAVTATVTTVSAPVAAVLAWLGLVHGECPAAVLLTV